MEVDLHTGGNPTVVVRGDIDFRYAPQIIKTVEKLLRHGHDRIDVQLAGVEFMDSSGISALLDSVKLAREHNARLVLVSPPRQLVHLLEESGFKPLFEFENLPVPAIAPEISPVSLPVYWQMTEFTVPCNPELVADIRHRITQVTDSMPFTLQEIEDIKLAVGEAATNAFRYGCPHGMEDSIRVHCIGNSSGLTVEITDAGMGFDPALVPVPQFGSLEPGGRGIFFMRLTMDKVEFERLRKGTLVRMVKYLTPLSAGS